MHQHGAMAMAIACSYYCGTVVLLYTVSCFLNLVVLQKYPKYGPDCLLSGFVFHRRIAPDAPNALRQSEMTERN